MYAKEAVKALFCPYVLTCHASHAYIVLHNKKLQALKSCPRQAHMQHADRDANPVKPNDVVYHTHPTYVCRPCSLCLESVPRTSKIMLAHATLVSPHPCCLLALMWMKA